MSRKDGKMYAAERLSKTIDFEGGGKVNLDHQGVAGCLLVFWTKTAARKVYGKDVALREIREL